MKPNIALTVDAKGTRCPIPIIKTKQALKEIEVGQYLELLATDPSTIGDMEAMLSHLPHELTSYEETKEKDIDVYVLVVKKQ